MEQESAEGLRMATGSVTKANSLLTNPSAPAPANCDPALKRPDCQQTSLRAQERFDGRDGGFEPRGGAGGTKAFCCSLGVGLPARLCTRGLRFHMFGGARTNLAAPSGTNEVCLLEHNSHQSPGTR